SWLTPAPVAGMGVWTCRLPGMAWVPSRVCGPGLEGECWFGWVVRRVGRGGVGWVAAGRGRRRRRVAGHRGGVVLVVWPVASGASLGWFLGGGDPPVGVGHGRLGDAAAGEGDPPIRMHAVGPPAVMNRVVMLGAQQRQI